MSLTAFDVSTNHAFVGSPLYARNRVTPNTEAIARMVNTGATILFSSKYDFSFTIWPYASKGGIPSQLLQNRSLGNLSAFKTVKTGWNRFTYLVWGVDVICNPWTQQLGYSGIDPVRGNTVTAYNEAREISISIASPGLSMQESITNYRNITPQRVNRVPLNCVNPSSASTFNSFTSIYRFQRTIKVSVFNSAQEQNYSWVNTAGLFGGSWNNNVFHQLDTPSNYISPQDWNPTNETGFNPTNPILLNGQSLPFFSGLTANITNGTSFVLRSVDQDSQYRPLEYVDTIFQAVS